MANKFFHSNNQFNRSKTEHWHLASPPDCCVNVCVWDTHTRTRAREVIWYNNTKGLEGREFSDECAFTEPWLRLWAWNCPGAAEQHLHAQPRLVALMWQHSLQAHTHTHTHALAAFLLKRRTCGLGLTCKHREHQNVCEVLQPQRWPQVLHQNKEKLKACIHFFSLSLFLSTRLHRVSLWACLTTSSHAAGTGVRVQSGLWQPQQAAITRALGPRTLISFSLWSYCSFPPVSIKTLLFPPRLQGSNFIQWTRRRGLVYPPQTSTSFWCCLIFV